MTGKTTLPYGELAGWLAAAGLAAGIGLAADANLQAGDAQSVIVQGSDLAEAAALVRSVGGEITHELGIIGAVAAELTAAHMRELERTSGVRLYDNGRVQVLAKGGKNATGNDDSLADATDTTVSKGGKLNTGRNTPYTEYPALVGADQVHAAGIYGHGVTVAMLDTGTGAHPEVTRKISQGYRYQAIYDAILDEPITFAQNDFHGHGDHVASVMLSHGTDGEGGRYNGIAPDADLVMVRAFDDTGRGTYADVIRGVGWILANKDTYGIQVLNLSIGAPARSHYWDDPLNQAVMKAWAAGIVVVTSAGNGGPAAMTVGVPANLPYVITVGAMTDSYTPTDRADDRLTSFSAAGPTAEGFVKPELVAPGGHMLGLMNLRARLALEHPEYHDGGEFFIMSGTSQAAAVVSAIVALMLEHEPWLTPDDVKCRLMATARPALSADGTLAYSLFQQGAGLVNALAAVKTDALGCANQGLDVYAELAGTTHFVGRARQDDDGNYYLIGMDDSYTWDGGPEGFMWDGFMWNEGFMWDGFMWNEGFMWDGFMWNEGFMWDGFMWNEALTEVVGVNTWVEQE